jgi:alpha-tubulin suppressor-like RCC1 family protein
VRSSPVQIPGTTWNDINGGAEHALARKTDGTLWAWGLNASGQLGDLTNVSKSSPIQIPGTTWNDIAAGCNSSSARKTDGTLWGWGQNVAGVLGDGTATPRSSPVQIPGYWIDIAGTNAATFFAGRKPSPS